jgi:tetratricopeptide (TPR) repeat protein
LAEPTRVFVSYRREDSGHVAGRLADRLDDHFQVVMDIDTDTIEPGMDFTECIRRAVTEADVFVAVIGPRWTELLNSSGQRRLDDPNDWVTAEIATALERGVPVLPVLVDGASMPTRAELPEALAGLASRQAVILRRESFTSDSSRLVGAIERRIPASRGEAEPPEAQLANWEAQADAAAREGRWADAVELLERVKAADPSFGQVARKLPAALRLRRTAELKREIRGQADAGNWQVVLNLGSELGSLDPTSDDPDGLVTRARQSLAEARRQHLDSLCDRAVEHEAAGRWKEAADALQQINALDPRNADIANRLQAVRLRMNTPTPSTKADQASAAMMGGPREGGSTPGAADIAEGPPTVPPPPGPVRFDTEPQPEQEKRSRLPFVLVGAAVVLVGIFVAAVLLINPGRDRASTAPRGGPSSSVSPEATQTPTPSSAEVAQLLSHVPTDIRDTCQEYEVVDRTLKSGVLAGVNCAPPGNGPKNAWYLLYGSEAATKKAFAEFVTGTYKSGDCTKKQQMMTTVTTEDGAKLPAGVLKCYVGRETNDTTFAWTHEDLHILAFADDPDMTFPKMKSWWLDAGPFRNP